MTETLKEETSTTEALKEETSTTETLKEETPTAETLTTEQLNTYAENGTRDTWPNLDAQATYTFNLGTTYVSALRAAGMPEDLLEKLQAKQKECAILIGTRREAEVDSQLATGGGIAAMDAAKGYLYKMEQVLPMAIRGVKLDDLKPEHVLPRPRGSKSVGKIKARLEATRPLVLRIEEKLKRYFAGRSPVVVLDEVIAGLQAAKSTQAAAQQARSPETFKLRVAKGQLLEMIEDVNRFGRVAFMGRAEMIGKFNKDLLLKARRSSKSRQTESRESEVKVTTTPAVTPVTTPTSPA
jgi:hypothetical protein